MTVKIAQFFHSFVLVLVKLYKFYALSQMEIFLTEKLFTLLSDVYNSWSSALNRNKKEKLKR